jgi:hypothetical protein
LYRVARRCRRSDLDHAPAVNRIDKHHDSGQHYNQHNGQRLNRNKRLSLHSNVNHDSHIHIQHGSLVDSALRSRHSRRDLHHSYGLSCHAWQEARLLRGKTQTAGAPFGGHPHSFFFSISSNNSVPRRGAGPREPQRGWPRKCPTSQATKGSYAQGHPGTAHFISRLIPAERSCRRSPSQKK